MKNSILYFMLFLLTNLFIIDDAEAIPAFARRYKISCSTCHAPFPKLKPYGDDFAGAGFILQEEEKERDYVTAGDDLLWLNKEFPVAARFEAYGLYESDSKTENDLQTPYGLKLLSGGTLYTTTLGSASAVGTSSAMMLYTKSTVPACSSSSRAVGSTIGR